MTTYRKKKGSDTWHWCKNCPYWPKDSEDYDEVTLPGRTRPSSGELDNGCLAKERRGECQQ